MGAIMLTIILLRVLKGHFDSQDHFGFEAVAWYY
jgi:cytochrome c oxidase subunit 3